MEKNLFWFKEWSNLSSKYNCNLEKPLNNNMAQCNRQVANLIQAIKERAVSDLVIRARQSQHHQLYKKLLPVKYFYINEMQNIDMIRTVFKIRGELLNLNHNP